MEATALSAPFVGCMTAMFSCEPKKMDTLLCDLRQARRVATRNTGTAPEVTPTKQDARLNSQSSSPNRVVYHSPESIKLKVPTSTPETPPPPSAASFCQTPQRVMKALITPEKCRLDRTPRQSSKRGYLVLPDNEEEHEDSTTCRRCLDHAYDYPLDIRQQPDLAALALSEKTANNQVVTVRLTLDSLKHHENRATQISSCAPRFSGDTLARSVIQSKSRWQLAKERKLRAQQQQEEAECQHRSLKQSHSDPGPTTTTRNLHAATQQTDWMRLEREKSLAAAWQRKKNERKEHLRVEQLRIAELERQRTMRLVEQRGRGKSTPIEI